jgi:hypothetical protein
MKANMYWKKLPQWPIENHWIYFRISQLRILSMCDASDSSQPTTKICAVNKPWPSSSVRNIAWTLWSVQWINKMSREMFVSIENVVRQTLSRGSNFYTVNETYLKPLVHLYVPFWNLKWEKALFKLLTEVVLILSQKTTCENEFLCTYCVPKF